MTASQRLRVDRVVCSLDSLLEPTDVTALKICAVTFAKKYVRKKLINTII
jgi:hypothetical protein